MEAGCPGRGSLEIIHPNAHQCRGGGRIPYGSTSFSIRISKLSRIVTVQDVRIGAPRVDQGRVVTQTVFDLVAYAAPQEKKFVTPVPAAKPK